MKTRLPLALIAVILIAGCVQSPDFLAKSNPLVKDFLEKYPNAEVKIVFFSKLQAQNIIESLKETCGNPYMEAKDFYIISIADKESNLVVSAVLDWNNKTVECAVKMSPGTPSKSLPTMPGQPSTPEYPPTKDTPIETPTPTPIGACPSCNDSNKCTFDYCNEFTNFECKHKAVEPCYNDGNCEELETNLPSGPSCLNLGWGAAGRVSGGSSTWPVEAGYFDYVEKINSGQNNDCPATCEDGNANTSDYFDFNAQQCKHYDCFAASDKTPPTITIVEPKNGTTLSTRSTALKLETNEDATCWYALDPYPYSPYSRSALGKMANTGFKSHSQALNNLYDSNQVYISCTDNSDNKQESKIIFYAAKEQSLYPKWEQDNVSITPASLDSGGGAIEAVIATQDNGSPSISSVAFTLSTPGVVNETKTATDTCATAIHTGYTSRCWKAAFNILANSGNANRNYTITVSNANIPGTRSGSFTVPFYSGPPSIKADHINNTVAIYTSVRLSVYTNTDSTCSYNMDVLSGSSVKNFGKIQMPSTGGTFHYADLSVQANSTYNAYIACTHLQYSSTAFVTFRTNETLSEPSVFTT
ncbi:MAG: hypothetical protein HYT72_00970 [Candidatus Aenigmarchaeota archaeon]|nr:hypothetical protein [Candidatus Aenigmarchaeota archaeon]